MNALEPLSFWRPALPILSPVGCDRERGRHDDRMYDFLLYGQVTGLVFGKLFFLRSDPLVGMLQEFAIYAVGFVARPVGRRSSAITGIG